MASVRAPIVASSRPWRRPLRRMFSRPVRSGENPVPSSSRAPIRPVVRTVPSEAASVPHSRWRRVDLPDPLAPMTPTDSPRPTVKDTSRRAQVRVVRAARRCRAVGATPGRCVAADQIRCRVRAPSLGKMSKARPSPSTARIGAAVPGMTAQPSAPTASASAGPAGACGTLRPIRGLSPMPQGGAMPARTARLPLLFESACQRQH